MIRTTNRQALSAAKIGLLYTFGYIIALVILFVVLRVGYWLCQLIW